AAHRGDFPAFWKAAADAFGQQTANQLQVHGKLALLTINNAALMEALAPLGDPLRLVQAGYHPPRKWGPLLRANVPMPPPVPGDATQKPANYAAFLAAQLRLSYPTAAVAEMARSGFLPVDVPLQVGDFLTAHQGKFEIGMQPIQQYINRNKLNPDPAVVTQIK